MSNEQNLDEDREELRERIRAAAIRWEVHSKTVAGWLEMGAEMKPELATDVIGVDHPRLVHPLPN